MRKIWMALAIASSALAVVSISMILKARWAPHADFDVTGFMWLLQNIGPIAARGFFVIFGAAALYAWFRAFREE